MLTLNMSHCWNNYERGQSFARCDGEATAASEVVAIGIGCTLEQSEGSQATQLARQRGGQEIGQQAQQIAPRQAVNVELWSLDGAQESLIVAIKEVEALERPVAIALGLSDTLEQALGAALRQGRGL
jgi:hypothetical protein